MLDALFLTFTRKEGCWRNVCAWTRLAGKHTELRLPLSVLQSFERRLWKHQHALRQFETTMAPGILNKLEDRGLSAERLSDMGAQEIGAILRHPHAGPTVRGCLDGLPSLFMEAQLQPITR